MERAAGVLMKDLLRRVYRRVHPDLFGAQPAVQAVNQKSMQELQSLWDRTENPDPGARPPKKCHLTFFFNSKPRDKNSITKAQVWIAPGPHFKNGLLGLLSQLHPGEDFSKYSDLSGSGGLNQPDDTLAWLRKAGDLARRGVLDTQISQKVDRPRRDSPETSVGDRVFATTLQRVYGLQLVFGNDLSPQRRQILCKRLAQAVDSLNSSEGLWRGGCVEMNGGAQSAVSAQINDKSLYQPRRLVLGACSVQERWTEALSSSAFVQVCKEERDLQGVCQKIESRVAQTLGVSLVLASCPAHGNETYLEFLKSLDAAASAMPLPDDYSSVAVVVDIGEHEEQDQFDERVGVIRVKLSEGALSAVHVLREQGPLAQKLALKLADVESLRSATRKSVRARFINRRAGLSDGEWTEGLERLRGAAGLVRGAMEGIVVVVGRELRVDEHRGEVEVPWNMRFG